MPLDPLNKLCKWRMILAGWHAGSKSIDEGGAQAMRDLMDKWLILRVETRALANMLVKGGVCTLEEYDEQIMHHAGLLDQQMADLFQGFRTSDVGVEIYDMKLAQQTMAKLGFPP